MGLVQALKILTAQIQSQTAAFQIIGRSLPVVAKQFQDISPVVVRQWKVRAEFYRFIAVFQGLVEKILLSVRCRTIRIGNRVLRIKLDNLGGQADNIVPSLGIECFLTLIDQLGDPRFF